MDLSLPPAEDRQFQGELNEKDFVQPGVFHAEKLVNMSKHNYRLEPNVSFTPDQKWVVFRSNMFGAYVRLCRRGRKERNETGGIPSVRRAR